MLEHYAYVEQVHTVPQLHSSHDLIAHGIPKQSIRLSQLSPPNSRKYSLTCLRSCPSP